MVSKRQIWVCTTIENGLDWSLYLLIVSPFYFLFAPESRLMNFFLILSIPAGILFYGIYRIIDARINPEEPSENLKRN